MKMNMKPQDRQKQKMKMSPRMVLVAAAATSIVGLTLVLIFIFNVGNIRSLFAGSTTYYSRADGSWNNKSTWSTSGFGGSAATSYPQAGDKVFISGNEIKIDKAAAACSDITFEDKGSKNAVLDVSNGYILSVAGNMSLTHSGGSSDLIVTIHGTNTTVNIGGNLAATVTGGKGDVQVSVANSSILNISGNATMTLTAGNVDASFTTADNSEMNVDGNTTMTSTGGSSSGELLAQDSSSINQDGNVVISSTKQNLFISLQDNSAMTIGGSLSTSGTSYQVINSSSSSTLTFLGQADQEASGQSTDTLQVSNLVVDNAADGVTLSLNMRVTNSLKLVSGKLKTSATSLLVLGSNATCTGGSAESYVEGPMRKEGSTAFVFPLGKKGVYAPIGISTPSAFCRFTAQYFDTSYAYQFTSNTLQNVSIKEYWALERTYGTSSPLVTLYWSDAGHSGIERLSTLKVAYYNQSANQWEDGGQSVTTGGPATGQSGSVTASSISQYKAFTFGSSAGNTLPVELLSFDAKAGISGVKLDWSTVSEINNNYFQLERSSNGSDFTPIGQVKGHGTTQVRQDYNYLDEKPLAGRSYYRLKQVDYNGAFEYFKIKSVEIAASSIESVGPNPFRDHFDVQYNLADAGAVSLQLLSMDGHIAFEDNTTGVKGANTYNFTDQRGIKEGVYILRLIKDGATVTTKLIKSN